MLLALDIGNSSISFGVFSIQDGKLNNTFKLTTDKNRSTDEYVVQICAMLKFYDISTENLSSAIISSVVPSITHTVAEAIKKITSSDVKIVRPGQKTGFSIRIDNPSELGSDLVANTAAVLNLTKGKKVNILIIDMGTATTISAITQNHEYVGNSIMPGIKLSLSSLHSQAELIPIITPLSTKKIIGKNSTDSVRSGIIIGNSLMIDAFIDEYEKELCTDDSKTLIYITGGFAEMILPLLRHRVIYEPYLTLKGLFVLYQSNSK